MTYRFRDIFSHINESFHTYVSTYEWAMSHTYIYTWTCHVTHKYSVLVPEWCADSVLQCVAVCCSVLQCVAVCTWVEILALKERRGRLAWSGKSSCVPDRRFTTPCRRFSLWIGSKAPSPLRLTKCRRSRSRINFYYWNWCWLFFTGTSTLSILLAGGLPDLIRRENLLQVVVNLLSGTQKLSPF